MRAEPPDIHGHCAPGFEPLREALSDILAAGSGRWGARPPEVGAGFADPDPRLAFGYAMNQGRGGWQHRHVRHLIDLVYASL